MIVVVEQDAEIRVRERFGDIRLILALHLGWRREGHVGLHTQHGDHIRDGHLIHNRFFFPTGPR